MASPSQRLTSYRCLHTPDRPRPQRPCTNRKGPGPQSPADRRRYPVSVNVEAGLSGAGGCRLGLADVLLADIVGVG